MARKTGKGKGYSRNPADWTNFEFVTVNLTEAQAKEFRVLQQEGPDELDDATVTLLEGRYKLSVVYDALNSCFIASLTCKQEDDENYGYVLSSRSADPWEAIRLCSFKTVHVCKDGSWPKEKTQTNWG